jgi:predicted PurR-regulated permease PerM
MNPIVDSLSQTGSSRWLATILLLAAAAVLAFASSDQNTFAQTGPQGKPTQTSADKETWQQYEESFETRWRDLLQHPQKGDKSKWTVLENDLRANAKKYNQRLEEETSKPMTGTTAVVNSTFTVPCLSQYDRPGYRCFMFPERNGDCRYLCIPIVK